MEMEWEAEWQRNGPNEILEEAGLELICNGYEKKAAMVGHVNRGWGKENIGAVAEMKMEWP